MMRTLALVIVVALGCRGTSKVTVSPGPLPVPATDTTFPATAPAIETSAEGGMTGHPDVPTVAIWNDGTVRFSGPSCTRKATLPAARVAELNRALGRVDMLHETHEACPDAIYVYLTVAARHERLASGCNRDDRGFSEAMALVDQVVGKNPCPMR